MREPIQCHDADLATAGQREPAVPNWRPRSPGSSERDQWRCDAAVAQGRSFALQLPPDRTPAVLQVNATVPDDGPPASSGSAPGRWALSGPCGNLWLEEGAALTHALTGIAVDAHSGDAITAAWLQEAASAKLRESGLPGFDQVLNALPQGDGGLRKLRLLLQTHDHQFASAAWIDGTALTAWLALASPVAPTPISTTWRRLAADWPVVVARHRLAAAALQRLSCGSLIKPAEAFSPGGRGRWTVGPRAWQVVCDGHRLFLEHPMKQDIAAADTVAETEAATASTNEPIESAALDSLPIDLRFEVGSVRMSFGEAARLQPGSELPLSRAAGSCEVAIKVGASQIGRGELVEVEGSLVVRVVTLHAPRS
jgi:type III secretion system YscQ/HrcQ family protein